MQGKIKISLFALSAFLMAILSACATFSPSDKLYVEARDFAREGRGDFAFLALSELLREYPNYRFAPQAKFAIAEYHVLSNNYTKAISELVDFLNTYPDNELNIFAKAMLYKIISDVGWLENETAADIAKEIRRQFFSQSAFFVFSEFKETSSTSLLGNTYVLKEYVDKIDIFQNDKLFFSVSP